MNLCVIPARGGSKRIPRKNIRPFAGKPMIAWAIEAAIASQLFNRVIVSTDDLEIRDTSIAFGAEVPFLRPLELADDHTPTVPVVRHAINECEAGGHSYEFVCCIYACVPFIETKDLQAGLTVLQESRDGFVFPVTEFPSAVQRALRRESDGRITPFYPEFALTRTQDLEPAYYDAGQFYWGSSPAWQSCDRIHGKARALIIPASRVVDIDTHEDWARAERLRLMANSG